MLGQVVFDVRGRERTATLTDQGCWECDDQGVAEVLNANASLRVLWVGDMDVAMSRYELYRAGARLGGRVRVRDSA